MMGRMEAFQECVYRAYFVEGKNIALLDELLQIAQDAGLPEGEARMALEEGVFANEVDDDWQRARLLGISGVPAFLCGRRLMVGFRPYQELVALIEEE
jgi:predicted DsbA family dithiol-disulfide isomerase